MKRISVKKSNLQLAVHLTIHGCGYMCFTEVEGGECMWILDFCITTSKCTERCLKYKGDRVEKSECKVPEVHPGQPIYPFRMCFRTYIYM